MPNLLNDTNILDTAVILLTGYTMLVLIWVIRPTKKYFDLRANLGNFGIKNYVMWPKDKDEFPGSSKDYKDKIEKLNELLIRDNYKEAHYVTLKLVQRKYNHYRKAGLAFKVMISVSFFRILIAFVCN